MGGAPQGHRPRDRLAHRRHAGGAGRLLSRKSRDHDRDRSRRRRHQPSILLPGVNYDLPWNPQRIEQRIGRCHRYGQQHDVVVVNFSTKNNAADQRVYELLAEKFKLFDGVFGASDEVLGAIESGVDFEKRIVSIYQNCRSTEETEAEFERLRTEMESNITVTMEDTRRKLLENFDAEVHDRLKVNMTQSKEYLDRYARMLWSVTIIASFVSGIVKDIAAVRAAIALPWSNGQTEGLITKLKLVKRQMYGRAKIDLLQARLIGAI